MTKMAGRLLAISTRNLSEEAPAPVPAATRSTFSFLPAQVRCQQAGRHIREEMAGILTHGSGKGHCRVFPHFFLVTVVCLPENARPPSVPGSAGLGFVTEGCRNRQGRDLLPVCRCPLLEACDMSGQTEIRKDGRLVCDDMREQSRPQQVAV